MPGRVIHLHAAAPPKPAPGAPCNGCGVCCAAEPCPLGIAVSGRLRGACRALVWQGGASRYRCGLLAVPLAGRLAARWIAAGSGCDCSLQPA